MSRLKKLESLPPCGNFSGLSQDESIMTVTICGQGLLSEGSMTDNRKLTDVR